MLNTVLVRDVQQTLDHFRRSVDRILGDSFSTNNSVPTTAADKRPSTSGQVFCPLIESGWNESEMCVRAVLPGVDPQNVQVSIRGSELILEGERKAPANWANGAYTQLAYGKFYAAVLLPPGLNLERTSSRLHEGVLDISIPLAEEIKPRQIPIQTNENTAAISA